MEKKWNHIKQQDVIGWQGIGITAAEVQTVANFDGIKYVLGLVEKRCYMEKKWDHIKQQEKRPYLNSAELLQFLHDHQANHDHLHDPDVDHQHHIPEEPYPTPQDDVDGPLDPNYIVFTITLVLVFLVVIGNSITILVFSSTPKLCNQTGFCLINLAIADLLTGLIYLPFSLPCSLTGECLVRTNRALCLSVVSVSYTCYCVSIFTLVIVMIDRYLQIDHPFHYNQIFSKTRALAALVSTWIAVFVFTIGFILSLPDIIVYDESICHCTIAGGEEDAWPYTLCINIFCFCLPGIVIIGCSLKIAMIAHRARSAIADQEAAVASAGTCGVEGNRPVRHHVRRSDVRILIRIFVVVVAFIICCMPFNIELMYARHTGHMFPGTAAVATVLMVEINSALNPIIYVTTYSKFRQVVRSKYFKLCRKSNHRESVVWTVTSHHRDQYSPARRRTTVMTISPPNHRMSTVAMMMNNECLEEHEEGILESVPESEH